VDVFLKHGVYRIKPI